jgi:hypothetical protein
MAISVSHLHVPHALLGHSLDDGFADFLRNVGTFGDEVQKHLAVAFAHVVKVALAGIGGFALGFLLDRNPRTFGCDGDCTVTLCLSCGFNASSLCTLLSRQTIPFSLRRPLLCLARPVSLNAPRFLGV